MLELRRRLCGLLPAVLPAAFGCSGLLGLDEFTGGADGGMAGSGGSPAGTGGTATGTAGAGGSGGAGATGGGTLGPWSPPKIVDELNAAGADDDDPAFTDDLLEVYINSNRDGNYDIYRSTRSATSDPWGTPVRDDQLSSVEVEGNVAIAPDGLTIWFARLVAGPDDHDIFVSKRIVRGASWEAPEAVTELNELDYADYPCAVAGDGLRMVLSSKRGDLLSQLYVTTRASKTALWHAPLRIDELNSEDDEQEAWLSPTGRYIYFASNRSGSAGSFDIYQSRLDSTDVTFEEPVRLGDAFNTEQSDSDPWLSSDRRHMMFSRGPDSNRDIYYTYRTVE